MKKESSLQSVNSYKNQGKKVYRKKEYDPFSEKEFQFINQSLNWDVERFIGYVEIEDLKEVNGRE